MKLTPCLTLLLVVSCLQSYAQETWIPDGAKWSYFLNSFWEGYGSEVMQYVGDTTIDNRVCKKLKRDLYIISNATNEEVHVDLGQQFVHQNGDTLWEYMDSTFKQLYNMSLAPGDTADFMNATDYLEFTSVVEDTATANFNGISLRSQTMGLYVDSVLCQQVQVIEKLGIVEHPFPFFWREGTFKVADGRERLLLCYKDDASPEVLLGSMPCQYGPFSTSLPPENRIVPARLMPNPVHDFAELTSQERGLSIEIFGPTGKRLYQASGLQDGASIDFSAYSPGLYLIRLAIADKTWYQKIIKN